MDHGIIQGLYWDYVGIATETPKPQTQEKCGRFSFVAVIPLLALIFVCTLAFLHETDSRQHMVWGFKEFQFKGVFLLENVRKHFL